MKPGQKGNTEEHAHRIAQLVAGYLRQTLSEEEHDELDNWITASDENQRLFEELTNPEFVRQGIKDLNLSNSEKALKIIKTKVDFTQEKKEKSHKKRRIIPYGIAATVLLLVFAFGIYLMRSNRKNIQGTTDGPLVFVPGGNKAVLVLANGQQLDLSAARNGLIDTTSGSDVLKSADGQISYESHAGKSSGSHTLITPVGGQYSVTLPDGTRVWLNASSKLTYPVWFTKEERVVQLEGEAYFEVAKMLRQSNEEGGQTPFIVELKNDAGVLVTGTRFNVTAYQEETDIRTTLLEGKVTVVNTKHPLADKALVPGQQASMGSNGELKIIDDVDTSTVVAWKNGKFKFKAAPIDMIMQQVARWYDAEIVYEGKVNYHFNATIDRTEPVSKLLKLLEATGNVKFDVKERVITVRP